MSKFFVTNNLEWFNKLKIIIEESPFSINGEYKNNGVFAITSKKLQVNNVNFLQEDDNFAIQTGTCVYKELSGFQALTRSLSDFDGNVQAFRENFLGNFGCVIRKRGNIVVFNEATSFYDIYYYNENGNWMVGTALFDMAKVIKKFLTLNKLNVLEELTRFAIFGNETYFNEIKRLSGDQYIEISSSKFHVYSLDLNIYQDNINDYNLRIRNISKEMKYIASVMYKNFGTTTLGCTGGFDSRMTLAAYLANDLKPQLSYGYGNSYLATSSSGDVDVNKLFSERYKLNLKIEPWNETVPIDKLWDEQIKNIGKIVYDGCEDAYRFYTKKEEPFLSFGYMGELFREDNWSKNKLNGTVTLEDYLWGFHAQTINYNIIKENKRLTDRWIAKWSDLYKKHEINTSNLKREDLFWLILEYRQNADSHMCNFINQYKYAHYLMSEIRIVRDAYVDFDVKYDGKFMIRILKELYPDILEIPFFTHSHFVQYDKKHMSVREYKSHILKNEINDFIKLFLPECLKDKLKKTFKIGASGSVFVDAVANLLKKENNEEKLINLIGEEIYKDIKIDINYALVLRGIVLTKTFEQIGIKY